MRMSLESHKKVSRKLWESPKKCHKKVTRKSWKSYVINKSWVIFEKVMKKSRVSHETIKDSILLSGRNEIYRSCFSEHNGIWVFVCTVFSLIMKLEIKIGPTKYILISMQRAVQCTVYIRVWLEWESDHLKFSILFFFCGYLFKQDHQRVMVDPMLLIV